MNGKKIQNLSSIFAFNHTFCLLGIVNGVAQNRIDIKPFGLNISIGDILNPLSGGNGGSVSEKTSSLVGVPNTDNQHKELIARIRQKVFANCTLVPLDIVFVVDGSSSIGRLDFQVVKLFVADIADIFAGAGRFAVVQYSEYPRTEFHLAETTDMTPQQLRGTFLCFVLFGSMLSKKTKNIVPKNQPNYSMNSV